MSGYEIKFSVTALCVCCGKELPSNSYLTKSSPAEGVFDRDNPYERKDREVFITPCGDCFVHRAPVAELIEAAEAYAEAEASLANREIDGINAESIDRLQPRAHAAYRDLENALARVKGGAA